MNTVPESNESCFAEYLTGLDSLVGSSGRFLKISNDPNPFWLIAYDDVPEVGDTTAFTFGISSIRHESWILGAPELVISMNSKDDDWLLSLGAISACLRGQCPYSLGDVLRFGKPLSNESHMSAFLVFWPTILKKDQQRLQLSDRLIIFKQAYPLFESEAELLEHMSPQDFFMKRCVDYSDVRRTERI